MASILFLGITTPCACQSSAKKVKNAEDNVQEAKNDLADSKKDLYEIRLDTISNYEKIKTEPEKLIVAKKKKLLNLKPD